MVAFGGGGGNGLVSTWIVDRRGGGGGNRLTKEVGEIDCWYDPWPIIDDRVDSVDLGDSMPMVDGGNIAFWLSSGGGRNLGRPEDIRNAMSEHILCGQSEESKHLRTHLDQHSSTRQHNTYQPC